MFFRFSGESLKFYGSHSQFSFKNMFSFLPAAPSPSALLFFTCITEKLFSWKTLRQFFQIICTVIYFFLLVFFFPLFHINFFPYTATTQNCILEAAPDNTFCWHKLLVLTDTGIKAAGGRSKWGTSTWGWGKVIWLLATSGPGKSISFHTPGCAQGTLHYEGIKTQASPSPFLTQRHNKRVAPVNLYTSQTIWNYRIVWVRRDP